LPSKFEIDYEEYLTPILRWKNRRFPLFVTRGYSSFVEDHTGKRYIDFTSGMGAAGLGHCPPEVIRAVSKQLNKLIHICAHVAMYEPYLELSRILTNILPKGLGFPFFTNSGAEANEAALKLAKWYTNRDYIIAFLGSFHGMTAGAFTITTVSSRYKERKTPTISHVIYVPFPYCYRCFFRKKYPECQIACLDYLKIILKTIVPPSNVAAIILEPIQGDGGVIVPPVEFVKELREICNENDILLIFDEIQTGLGRTGKMFACEHFGITPDIMTLGKTLANGFPLGAMVARKDLIENLENFPHGSTFGGNPISCVAAISVVQSIIEKNVIENVISVGSFLKKELEKLAHENILLGDIRGKGLMLGVEIVKDKDKDRTPDPERTRKIVEVCYEKGLLIPIGGIFENVLRFLPPLNLDLEVAKEAVKIFSESIDSVMK
jgi:4-aminobutyrate aminotransferase